LGDTKANSRNRSVLRQITALLFSLILTVLIFVQRDALARFSYQGYLGLFLISLLGNATVLLPVPSLAATFIAGSVLHPLAIAVVSGAGMAIGELTGYLAGYGGTAFIEARDWALHQRLLKWMQNRGFLTIFVLAAIPNPIFDLAGVTAGMSHFPVRRFLLASFLGKILKSLVFALAGAQSVRWLGGFL